MHRRPAFRWWMTLAVLLGFGAAGRGQTDGQLRWTYSTLSSAIPGNILSSPAQAEDGTIYVGVQVGSATSVLPAGRLFAIRPDGSTRWVFNTPDWVDSAPAIARDGTIYFGCWDGNVYALKPDGSRSWTYRTAGFVASSPAIGPDGSVYIGSGDGNLYALSSTGQLLWTFATLDWIESSPAVAPDGTLYVGSSDGAVYAIASNGTQRWRAQTEDAVVGSPCIAADGTVYVGSRDGRLYAFAPDGRLKWSFPTGDVIEASPVLGLGGVIYLGNLGGRMFAVRPDGTEAWRFPRSDVAALQSIYSSAAVRGDGSLVFGTSNNALYAVRADGTLLWTAPLQDWADSSPLIGRDGTIYVGCTDKRLYAFHGTQPPLLTEWPQYRRGPQREAFQVTGRVAGTTGRLLNISTRALAGTDSNTLIAGFVVGGSGARTVLVRGIGPTLQQFGVAGALGDPSLTAIAGGTVVASNDNWSTAGNAPLLAETFSQLGAFALPSPSLDSALLQTFGSGPASVLLTGKSSATAVALIELYDAGGSADARLINLSSRSRVGRDADVLIVGFVISGGPRTVLIRAVGPTLSSYGVEGVLANPLLRLIRGDRLLAESDDWANGGNAAELAAFAKNVGAFELPASSRDSVLLVTLPPGAYSAHIVGRDGGEGVALAELYEVD